MDSSISSIIMPPTLTKNPCFYSITPFFLSWDGGKPQIKLQTGEGWEGRRTLPADSFHVIGNKLHSNIQASFLRYFCVRNRKGKTKAKAKSSQINALDCFQSFNPLLHKTVETKLICLPRNCTAG